MTQEPTGAEDALAARVAELEKRALHKGSMSLWDFALSIVPGWLMLLAVGVFLAFYAWDFYNAAQQAAAKTKIENAKAARAAIEAKALNAPEGGGSLLLARLEADLAQKRQAAARARTEADALNARIGDATMREETIKAEVAAKQAEAQKAAAEASALSKKYGYQTLQQRAVRAKLILSEIARATQNVFNASPNVTEGGGGEAAIKAACVDNLAADLIGCPAQYITRRLTPIGAAQSSAPAPATKESGATPRGGVTNNAPAPEKPKAQASAVYATVATQGLNLRKCPDVSDACPPIGVGPLPQGLKVEVYGDAGNGWSKINVDMSSGRTLTGYVKTNKLQF
jgi:hypothetical protein